MKKIFQKLQNYFKENNYHKYVMYFIFGFFIFFGVMILWKYFYFKYDEIDLAIFNQTFFNLVNGRFLENTIQGQSYFGDHFAPLMFFIVPVYYLFQSPLTLLFLQLCAITGSAWLLFEITKRKLKNNTLALLVSVLFLLNFSIQQIVLFGFHLLPFFFCLFFGLYYTYLQKNYRLYVICIISCLLLREDVSLVVIPFSLIPLLEKRTFKWWLTPLVAGIVYFPIALYVISLFSIDGAYKFIQMYGWLGESWGEIFSTIVTQPFFVLKNLHWGSIFELVLGFLLPFFCLPLLGWRWLLVPSFIFGIHILPASGIEQIILQTHYSALIWPFVFLALIESLKHSWIQKNQTLATIILIISTVYTMILLGPVQHISSINQSEIHQQAKAAYNLIDQIPSDAGVVVSSDLLPRFSEREHVYALHYLFSGTRQFSENKYEVHDSVEYVLFNTREFRFLMSQTFTNQALYYSGQERIKAFMNQRGFSYTDSLGDYVLFTKMKNHRDQNSTKLMTTDDLFFDEFTYYYIQSCEIKTESEREGYIPLHIMFYKTTIKSENENLTYIGLKENDEDFLFGPNTRIQIAGNEVALLNHGYETFFDSNYDNEVTREFVYWIPKNSLSADTEFRLIQKKEASYFNYFGSIDFLELDSEELTSFRFSDRCFVN